MCENVGGCGSNSPMVGWLEKDLAANSEKKCTLAYFHPLFSSGEHGNQTKMTATWEALYAANADVVVNGHDHDYERFALQRPDGTEDQQRGIREFVVGTGGASSVPRDRAQQPGAQRRDPGGSKAHARTGRLRLGVHRRRGQDPHRLGNRELPLAAGPGSSQRNVLDEKCIRV